MISRTVCRGGHLVNHLDFLQLVDAAFLERRRQRLAIEQDLAFGWLQQAGDGARGGRFTGAGFADDSDRVPARHLDGDVVQHLGAAGIAGIDVIHLEHDVARVFFFLFDRTHRPQ
jgi:hypothetical protein